jgi:UrcA family protein
METHMSFRTLLTAAAFVAFAATAAQANTTANVVFGDLNLSHPEDAKILAGRLQAAAQQVCIKANPDIQGKAEMQQCVDAAIGMALAQIQNRMADSVRANLISDTETPANP